MHIDVIHANNPTPIQGPKPALKNGDVVQGKVGATADGKASITLQDGSALQATMGEGVQLAEGQHVKLMVTGQQDGKVTMQIVPEGDNAQKVIETALSNLSINGKGKNVELATAFIRQGVSLSPELMQKAADILAKNPGLDADTAAFMAANGMEADIGQAVQNLASKQNNINSQLVTLENILIESGAAPAQATNEGTGQSAAPVNIDGTVETAAQPPQQGEAGRQVAPQTDNAQTAGQAQAQAQPGQQAVQGAGPLPEGAIAMNRDSGAEQAAGTQQAVQSEAAQPAPDAARPDGAQGALPQQRGAGDTGAAVAGNRPAAQAAAPDQAPPMAKGGEVRVQTAATPSADFQPGPATVKALTIYIGRDNPSAVASLQADGLSAAANAVTQAAALPEQQGEAVLQAFMAEHGGSMEQADASKLQSQLANAAQTLRETVQPQQANGIGELLNKLESMFAKLDKPSRSVDIKQAANRLPERLEDMQEAVAKSAATAGAKDGMAAAVQRAVGQSKAMEQINQFVYSQIPMNMNGQKNMAELYVFKRPGKQKRIDAEQVTMVIALDTQNMGHVESLIKVDMKNVFLRFKVDGEDIASTLEAGMADASESLREIGYNLLELKCELNGEDINILNAVSAAQTEFLDVRKLDFRI